MPLSIIPQVILASTSFARQKILENAGVKFTPAIPLFDEKGAQSELAELSPSQLAISLAKHKSLSLQKQFPTALIIGADQTLSLGTNIYHKPKNLTEARHQLQILRGQTHILNSALCCTLNGNVIWACIEQAELTMRQFSDRCLDHHLAISGQTALTTVGAYRLEDHSIQLFEKIRGDYFTILGFPLLPFLQFLRQQSVLPQ